MPDMDGHHVARTIKAESPKTPVIMMTGWGTIMKEDGEPTPEVDAVVGKPPQYAGIEQLAPSYGLLTMACKRVRRFVVGFRSIQPARLNTYASLNNRILHD